MTDVAAGSEARAPLPQEQQQQQQQQQRQQEQQRGEDERVELLVAARLGQVEAAAAARVEQRLSAETADVVVAAGQECWSSMLTSAAALGRQQLLGALLKQRPQPARTTRSSSKAGTNPLVQDLSAAWLAAAEQGHPQCLKLLLEACASSSPAAVAELLQARDHRWDQDTALLCAARKGHVECLRLLLQHSPEFPVSEVNSCGQTALMLAAESQDAACHQLLLEHSPEVQVAAVDADGSNALMAAAMNGNAPFIKLLLAHSPGVQVAAEALDGACALDLAADSPSVACLQLLLAHPHSQQQLDKALLKACGRLVELKWEVAGVIPTAVDQRDLKQCVRLLLSKGAELDTGADKEISAVYWPISKELAARALVPDMANEAVLGLALAATAVHKRRASGKEAAGPSKRTRPSS